MRPSDRKIQELRLNLQAPQPKHICTRCGLAIVPGKGNQLRIWNRDGTLSWLELDPGCMADLHRVIQTWAASAPGTTRLELLP